MRVSLQWLSDYIDLPTRDPEELERVFNMLGHAVEAVDVLDIGWTDVRIGRVEAVEAHPDADSIRVTRVDLGDGELHQIICGAWNFEAGAVVPVATPGAVLPGDFAIGERTIRGVESRGMICSEAELGLGEAHEGIIVLSGDEPIGEPFESILELPDVVFDLEVTTNRPDAMSMVGIARELAAWYDIEFRMPDATVATVPGDSDLDITISATDGCNRFTAREVRGVTVAESPLWMRERLRKAGVRAISNAVDVTNYVMMELGHPLHAFDADSIVGGRLDVRWAADGETLETLDGTVRTFTTDDLVIVDDAGPTSMAAVMGGARSEVGDATTNVLMEAAHWDPPTVMYTSRRHVLQSEASKRFERGVDPNLSPLARDRACRILTEIAGGEIVERDIDVVANPVAPWVVELTVRDVTRLLGDGFEADRIADLLRRVHLDVAAGEPMRVTVPTNRPDLTRPADLVEEIARLADFETFPATVPTGPAGGLAATQRRLRRLHELLRGLGMHQAINLPFVAPDEVEAFGNKPDDVVTVRNPLREDQAKLRTDLLPALLRNVRDNLNRGAAGVALFETGKTFHAEPWEHDERVPRQPDRLGIVLAGKVESERLGSSSEAADARSALAAAAAIAEALGVDIEREAADPVGFHPTRTAALSVGGVVIGHAGEIHPDVTDMYDIAVRVGAIEVDLDLILDPRQAVTMRPVSSYPHVDYDLSFEVPPGVSGSTLLEATSAATELLESARVFDDYAAGDARSIAIRYRLRAGDRTLSADEIAAERQAMIEAAAGLGASMRGAS